MRSSTIVTTTVLAALLLVAHAPPARARKARTRAEKGLGPVATAVLREPQKAWRAVLRVIGAMKAQARAMRSRKTIVGYPPRGPLRALATDKAAAAGVLVLDDSSHHFGLRRRCANKRWHGARFERDGTLVELIVGTPCDQLIIARRTKRGAALWGVVMRRAAATKLRRLLGAKK
ncbi:MAG: hypothetical protein KC503_04640 [Myxococcales bacterium]|nr:hypothetical protein [Myxococcales bacterium]